MTNKEAIKYLQQLYPNGGHCWLDEQRIEAIGMAINALQEEPVSEQNLSNVQRIGKNWKEEPVSEKDKLRALSDGKQHLGWLDDANALEEPINKELDRHSNLSVGEDLEEAAGKYESEQQEKYKDRNNHDFDNYRDGFVDGLTHTYNAFKAGANWQKDKIEEILFRTVLPRFMHGVEAEEVVAMLDEEINHKED